jgi:uncharacterized phage protein gp47/JayE
MPILLANDADRILGEALNNLTDVTGLNKTSPGSKTRTLAEILSKMVGTFYTALDVNLIQSFISGASDRYLDFIGEMLGMPRKGQEVASASSAYQNIKFYVNLGTFGDINAGSSILVPSGTIISTQSGAKGIKYKLVTDLVLQSSVSSAFATVEALLPGAKSNVGTGQLKYHNFTSYTLFNVNALKVTNLTEIVSGREVENNENYRFRLANAVTAAEAANQMAVRLAVLSVPGVADMVLVPFYRGLGSFDIILKATTPTVPPGLIDAVQGALFNVVAQGNMPVVRAPRETGLSMTIYLKLRNQVSADEALAIRDAARTAVIDYVNNTDIGEEFIVNEVIERVMASDTRIKNMGSAPNQPIDSMYLYSLTRLQDNKNRTKLLGDYSTQTDERLIIEPDEIIGDPVTVLIEGY